MTADADGNIWADTTGQGNFLKFNAKTNNSRLPSTCGHEGCRGGTHGRRSIGIQRHRLGCHKRWSHENRYQDGPIYLFIRCPIPTRAPTESQSTGTATDGTPLRAETGFTSLTPRPARLPTSFSNPRRLRAQRSSKRIRKPMQTSGPTKIPRTHFKIVRAGLAQIPMRMWFGLRCFARTRSQE